MTEATLILDDEVETLLSYIRTNLIECMELRELCDRTSATQVHKAMLFYALAAGEGVEGFDSDIAVEAAIIEYGLDQACINEHELDALHEAIIAYYELIKVPSTVTEGPKNA